jgi:transcriptional regulator with XRE-family HTH domain
LKDVSKDCGISISYLSDIENERKNPSLDTLSKIAEALQVSQDRILGKDIKSLVDKEIKKLKLTYKDLAKKSRVPIKFFENMEEIIPDETAYEYATRTAVALDLPPSLLRAALARQEPPVYEGPSSSAADDFAEPFQEEHKEEQLLELLKDLPQEAMSELYNFIDYLKVKYSKKI